MKPFFKILIAVILTITSTAMHASETCDNCLAFKHALLRRLHPTKKPLTCANFTLPEKPGKDGKSVRIKVYVGDDVVLADAKKVTSREGQFCYPTTFWEHRGKPTRVFFCSEHSVTLRAWLGEVDPTLSGRGTKPAAYACLWGIAACGGVNNVSIPADQLN